MLYKIRVNHTISWSCLGDTSDIFFELSSIERVNILRFIKSEPTRLTSLAKSLGITLQECSRHVGRLTSLGLVVKDSAGVIRLTPYSNQILTQMKSLEFSTRHRDYFIDHTTEHIPPSFQMRIGELSDSLLVDDVMVVFKNIEKMYTEVEEYVLRVTDRLMLTTIPLLEKAFERGVKQRLLDPEDIVIYPDYRNTPKLDEALDSGQFIDHTVKSCDFFLSMSEKGVASLSFPRIDGRFDYLGFTSTNPDFHGWCLDLFEHYWATSKPKSREWLSKKLAESRRL